MLQANNSTSPHAPEFRKDLNPTTSKRAYHTPAAPQEFGQLRSLTLGSNSYISSDGGQFSAVGP